MGEGRNAKKKSKRSQPTGLKNYLAKKNVKRKSKEEKREQNQDLKLD